MTVDDAGLMTFEIDGALIAPGQGVVPADAARPSTLANKANLPIGEALIGPVDD